LGIEGVEVLAPGRPARGYRSRNEPTIEDMSARQPSAPFPKFVSLPHVVQELQIGGTSAHTQRSHTPGLQERQEIDDLQECETESATLS